MTTTARVRPRLRGGSRGGSPLLLIDALRPFVEAGAPGRVAIEGPAGSGKTVALELGCEALPGVRFLDEPVEPGAEGDGLIVYAARRRGEGPHLAVFEVSAWDRDDCVEYLLARDAARCADVLARVDRGGGLDSLDGSPELVSRVLDQFQADSELADVAEALRRLVPECLGLSPSARDLRLWAVRRCQVGDDVNPGWGAPGRRDGEGGRLLDHRAVQVLLAAEQVARDLEHGRSPRYLELPFRARVLAPIAARLTRVPGARAALEHKFRSLHNEATGPVATLLNAVDPCWFGEFLSAKPRRKIPLVLVRARLVGADCWSIRAELLVLSHLDLSRSRWNGSRLSALRAAHTSFDEAVFRHCVLEAADLSGCSFDGADLTEVEAPKANLRRASFKRAVLAGAFLRGANLRNADLTGADLTGADLTGADLSGAQLPETNVARATLQGANLERADLSRCDLERIELPSARLAGARLAGALLTESVFRDGHLAGVDLSGAGLAGVHWRGADLRDADFSAASFHLGSSRSGLVVGGYPSQGTRTGFYTEELTERFERPDAIRKADLRDTDLRGARVERSDFYLVDLRGALFTPDQERHFRACGAILRRSAS